MKKTGPKQAPAPRHPALRTDIRTLPTASGVYLMKDAAGKILYIGKAVNIRKRVASYFNLQDRRFLVTVFLPMVSTVDCLVTENGKEALILENGLIKTHKPKYNVLLKDDKSEYCLRIDPRHPFPRIEILRQSRRREDDALYFGPYSSAAAVKRTLEFAQKLFPLRTCTDKTFARAKRPCLEYHIKRCPAPCAGLAEEKEYRKTLESAADFLRGRKKEVLTKLKRRRAKASRALKFELARKLHESISAIEATLEKQALAGQDAWDADTALCELRDESAALCIVHSRGGRVRGCTQRLLKNAGAYANEEELLAALLLQFYERADDPAPARIIVPSPLPGARALVQVIGRGRRVRLSAARTAQEKALLEFARKTALALLQKEKDEGDMAARLQAALGLGRRPRTMACFDISHQGGTFIYASISVFSDMRPDTRRYRTLRLKGAGTDDCANMREALTRWFAGKRELEINLLVIDGGRTQLKVAREVLAMLGIKNIDLVSVAKSERGRDRIFFAGGGQAPKDMPEDLFRTLMHLRDEAHRFGIRHSRRGLEKAASASFLDRAPGIGPKRKKALLARFGSPSAIKAASREELRDSAILPAKAAQNLYNYLHEKDPAV